MATGRRTRESSQREVIWADCSQRKRGASQPLRPSACSASLYLKPPPASRGVNARSGQSKLHIRLAPQRPEAYNQRRPRLVRPRSMRGDRNSERPGGIPRTWKPTTQKSLFASLVCCLSASPGIHGSLSSMEAPRAPHQDMMLAKLASGGQASFLLWETSLAENSSAWRLPSPQPSPAGRGSYGFSVGAERMRRICRRLRLVLPPPAGGAGVGESDPACKRRVVTSMSLMLVLERSPSPQPAPAGSGKRATSSGSSSVLGLRASFGLRPSDF